MPREGRTNALPRARKIKSVARTSGGQAATCALPWRESHAFASAQAARMQASPAPRHGVLLIVHQGYSPREINAACGMALNSFAYDYTPVTYQVVSAMLPNVGPTPAVWCPSSASVYLYGHKLSSQVASRRSSTRLTQRWDSLEAYGPLVGPGARNSSGRLAGVVQNPAGTRTTVIAAPRT